MRTKASMMKNKVIRLMPYMTCINTAIAISEPRRLITGLPTPMRKYRNITRAGVWMLRHICTTFTIFAISIFGFLKGVRAAKIGIFRDIFQYVKLKIQ